MLLSRTSRTRRFCSFAQALVVPVIGCLVVGCGTSSIRKTNSPGTTASLAKLSGSVHGGQQPVSGSHVFLYAISNTNGGASQSLLNTPGGYVTTDSNGNWSISGDYTCPAHSYVYILAVGGNPGLAAGTNNAELSLASILGDCSALTPSSRFSVNEVTTAVAASAMSNLGTSETQLGSTDPTAIANDVNRNNSLVDAASGLSRIVTPDRLGTVPQAKINSLADSLAACVNSDGTGPACQTLMNASGVDGTSFTRDTFNAAIQIALFSNRDTFNIYNLSTANSPFQPTLSAVPSDWTLAAQYSGMPGGLGVGLTPDSATIPIGGQVALTVSSGNGGGYLWTTSGAQGTISDTNGNNNQTSICTDSTSVKYQSSGGNVTGPASDTVNVVKYQFSDCSGSIYGSATAAVTTVPSAASSNLSNLPTQTFSAQVTLPSGVDLPLDALSVIDSLSQTTPDTSGNFTLPQYTGAEQIVVVKGPDGTPMLMGWMDSNHTTVDERTTAEVLAFYGLGGPAVTSAADRAILISQIPQQNGFNDLVNTIDNELSNNVDAFAQPNANLNAALNSLFTQTTGSPTRPHAKLKPNDVTINPDSSTPQSGVSLSTVQPSSSSGYSTTNTITPWSTFLTNAYRRRTHYFALKQKDTLNGQDTPAMAAVADADVAPTSGLNGGVGGALSDIVQAYFGNQPTAYAPVTSDPFDLPVDSGFDSTTYQIINVGAGGSGKPSPVQLTSVQQATLVTTAVNGFVQDAIVPFLANAIIAGNDSAANTPLSGSSRSPFVLALEKNIAAVVSAAASSGTQAKIVGGDYRGALDDILFSAALQPLSIAAVKQSILAAVPNAQTATAAAAFESADTLLNAAGAGLQVFDTAVYSAQILGSDNVDVWSVTSTKFKATLSPAATTLNRLGSVQLQANVLNAPSNAQLSYKWTITPQTGQSLVGNITEIGGAGRMLPDASGNTSACSSSPTWGYANNASQFNALTMATTDTVTVTAFQGPNCVAAQQFTNTPSATVTNQAAPNVVITPATPQIVPGGNVSLSASFNDPKATTQTVPASWLWKLVANSGGPYGTLANADGTAASSGASFCSTSNAASYTSTQSNPFPNSQTDLAEATAYAAAGCQGTPLNQQPGISEITTLSSAQSPTVSLSPSSVTLQAGGSALFTATASNLQKNSQVSYQWTTTGALGSLTDTGGTNGSGRTNYCSSSSTATFNANPSLQVKEPQSDTLTVSAFTGTTCDSSQRVGTQQISQIMVQPTPSVSPSGTHLLGQMLASDGYVYAVGAYAVIPANTGPNWPALIYGDTIFQIASDGTTKPIVSFTHKIHNSYTGGDDVYSDGITPLVEGPDDALYGLAISGGSASDEIGYFYKFSLVDYSVTILHTFTQSGLSFGQDQYGNNLYVGQLVGPLLLANDGNFYVGGSAGIVRLTPSGDASIAYNAGFPSSYGPLVQASDGNLYTTQTTYLKTDSSGNILNYSKMALFTTSLSGSGNLVYTFESPSYLFEQPNTPLVAGSDGALYGTLRGERPGYGACEMNYPPPGQPDAFVDCSFKIGAASIFRASPSGVSTIYTFDSLSDGTEPLVGLIAGPDGNLYGAASAGGDLGSECTTFPTADELTVGSQYHIDANGNKTYGPPGPYRVADEGCGTIFRIKPGGGFTKMYQFQNGTDGRLSIGEAIYASAPAQMLSNLALDSAGDLLGSSGHNNPGTYPVTSAQVFKLPLFSKGPIQMTLSQSIVSAGTPVTLTWNVSNAYSLSAQQCYAHGIAGTAGGSWTGKQTGVADSSGYHGSTTVTPTASGTYTYELTCGGTESSVAILQVQ